MSKKELSIFVDESGDFGKYQEYCPFYVVTFLFHDQKYNLRTEIENIRSQIMYLNFPNNYIHAGPIIRQEDDYYKFGLQERRKAINIITNFARIVNIKYHSFIIERNRNAEEIKLTSSLIYEIRKYIKNNFLIFEKYNIVKIYYDNGQRQLAKILASILPNEIPCKVEFIKIYPAPKYLLFQTVDLITTLVLINEKIKINKMSKGEIIFFKTKEQFYKNYFKKINKKSC